MTSLRDERAAVLRRWHRDMGDNFTAVLPRVLDDLDATDRAHTADGIIKFDIPGAGPMTDEEKRAFAEQWLKAKDGPIVVMPPEPRPTAAEIMRLAEERWGDGAHEGPYCRQEILEGVREILTGVDAGPAGQPDEPGTGSVPPPGPVPPVPVSDKPPKAPPAARTATRRRTTR